MSVILVDLDGTLAFYDGWRGIAHIGAPIPKMLHRVRVWVAAGKTVKIFTARVSVPERDIPAVVRHIHEWCERHGLPRLEVTCVKGFDAVEIWDDHAVPVRANTGERLDGVRG